jgi:hypothetical protein
MKLINEKGREHTTSLLLSLSRMWQDQLEHQSFWQIHGRPKEERKLIANSKREAFSATKLI